MQEGDRHNKLLVCLIMINLDIRFLNIELSVSRTEGLI